VNVPTARVQIELGRFGWPLRLLALSPRGPVQPCLLGASLPRSCQQNGLHKRQQNECQSNAHDNDDL